MNVRLRYFDGCPNWQTTYDRLRGLGIEPALEQVETPEEAERLRFVGSPTILVDGRDPFPILETSFGLSCRLYETPDGLAGSPTVDQLRRAVLGPG